MHSGNWQASIEGKPSSTVMAPDRAKAVSLLKYRYPECALYQISTLRPNLPQASPPGPQIKTTPQPTSAIAQPKPTLPEKTSVRQEIEACKKALAAAVAKCDHTDNGMSELAVQTIGPDAGVVVCNICDKAVG